MKTESLPVVALVGCPNVGKSTLFNRLTRTRNALVAPYPGLTRDRQYGRCRVSERPFLLVDTAGVQSFSLKEKEIGEAILRQVEIALKEADLVLLIVDAREGLTAADEEIAEKVRLASKPTILVINKIDSRDPHLAAAEFWDLGFGEVVGISAAHGLGQAHLVERIEANLPQAEEGGDEGLLAPTLEEESIRVAVIGRPNVGKSTLVNRLAGEERVVVTDVPGTTRDTIAVPFERDGQSFLLFDTAGIRRKSRIEEAVEKFSVIKAMQAIEQAQVVIFLIDAKEGVTDQDARLLGLILEMGKALVVGLNKWDGLDGEQKRRLKAQLATKLAFVDFAEKIPLSALYGTGVGDLFDRVAKAENQARAEFSTAHLTRILHEAIERNPPPRVHGRRIRLKFAHQGGKHPPLIVIYGNQTENISATYRRFLFRYFLRALGIKGTPLRIEFRESENPYQTRRWAAQAR